MPADGEREKLKIENRGCEGKKKLFKCTRDTFHISHRLMALNGKKVNTFSHTHVNTKVQREHTHPVFSLSVRR